MTTQNISKYISDTKKNILIADVSDNTFAHAIDTNELLLKRDGSWIEWRFNHNTGTYQLPGTDIVVNNTPLTHLDVSDTNTILHNNDGIDIRGSNMPIDRVHAQAGTWSMTNNTNQQPPVYRENLINNLPGLYFSNNSSLVTTDLHVRQRVFHGDFTAFMVVKPRNYYQDWGDTTPYDSFDRRVESMLWGSHSVHLGVDGYGGHNIGLWLDQASTAFYVRPMGLGLYQSHQAQIRTDTEPYTSGIDLRETPMIICSQYNSAHNSMGYTLETSDPDPIPTSNIVTVNVCNYQFYTARANSYTHTLAGLRLGGKGGFNLGEFMIFNSAMSTNDINNVGSHLATKWGSAWQS